MSGRSKCVELHETWRSCLPERRSHSRPQPKDLRLLVAPLIVVVVAAASLACAQSSLTDSSARSLVKSSTVEFLAPEQIAIPAAAPTAVQLHFRIEDGFHINSHTPKEAYLIPTVLAIPAGSGVALKNATYPPGSDYTLPVDPTTILSVYTGDFTIQARIVAARGDHRVEASLHYQACDKSACYPPKTIAVPIDVIGK